MNYSSNEASSIQSKGKNICDQSIDQTSSKEELQNEMDHPVKVMEDRLQNKEENNQRCEF